MVVQRIVLLLICCVSLYLVSCQKDTGPENTTSANPSGNPSITVNQATLLQVVNNLRQSGCTCGSTVMPPVAAVTWNDQLAVAALNHSNDMNTNNYFSHTALNGSTPGDRISAAGYAWKAYGENIAKGYSSEQAVIDGWLKSEDHCKNIMGSV